MAQTITSLGLAGQKFGTKSYLSGLTGGSLIVNSIRYTPQVVDAENKDGDGFTVGAAVGDNGFNAECECMYDSAVTMPAVGAVVDLKRPQDATAKKCYVTGVSPAVEKEGFSTVGISVKHRPDLGLA